MSPLEQAVSAYCETCEREANEFCADPCSDCGAHVATMETKGGKLLCPDCWEGWMAAIGDSSTQEIPF